MDKPQPDYYKVCGDFIITIHGVPFMYNNYTLGPINGWNYPLKNIVDTGFKLNIGKQPNIAQSSQTPSWIFYL